MKRKTTKKKRRLNYNRILAVLVGIIFFVTVAYAASSSFAQTSQYVYDNIDGTSLNTTLWNNITIAGTPTVEQIAGGGGYIRLNCVAVETARISTNTTWLPDWEQIQNISFQTNSIDNGGDTKVHVDAFGTQIFESPGGGTPTSLNYDWFLERNGSKFEVYNDSFHLTTVSSPSNNLLQFECIGDGAGGNSELYLYWMNFTTVDTVTNTSLLLPLNNTFIDIKTAIFNYSTTITNNNFSTTRDFDNATIYLWNSTGDAVNITTQTISGINNRSSFNLTGINLGRYTWNVYSCDDQADCAFSPLNRTLNAYNITEEFTTNVTEGQTAGLNMNLTFEGIDTQVLATLNWNNTLYTPSKTISASNRVRFTTSFVIPQNTGNTTGVPINHFWRFWLPNNSTNLTTATQSQNVFSIGLDDCTSNNNLLFNYTLYDEDTTTIINPLVENTSLEVDMNVVSDLDSSFSYNFSQTYSNTNNATVCISAFPDGYKVNSQVQYTGTNYVTEFHNIRGSTLSTANYPQEIALYPLLSSRSQEFLVTFKDTNFLPVENAIITVTRKYVGDGIFRTVEAPLTDSDGKTLIHLVLGDVLYTINVYQGTTLLGTFQNILPFCTDVSTGDCTLNLNAFTAGTAIQDFLTSENFRYKFDLNRDTRTITTTFSTIDGTNSLVNVTGTLFDNRGNVTACTNSVTTSSGTLPCVVPVAIGNSTIQLDLYKDNSFVTRTFFNLDDFNDTGFGATGIILAAILAITIPLMFISSGIGVVVGAIIGLITIALLNLYVGGFSILGVGSTIVWFIIGGIILIWKINSLRN